MEGTNPRRYNARVRAHRIALLLVTLLAFPSQSEAKPRSRSVGDASNGTLEHGVSVPLRGKALRVLGMTVRRGFTYGTEELVGALLGAAKAVRKEHPGSVLRLGNLSREGGGDISQSRSHNSGRDVDVAFYVTDAKSAPALPNRLVALGDGGRSRDGKYVLDVARSWAFVRHLLGRDDIQLEWAFCAHWLRALLLDHARKVEKDPAVLVRAEVVLKQPSDSSPHDDHFHVRIYCPKEDRLAGCANYGAIWPWTDAFRAESEAIALDLASVVLSKAPASKRTAALDRLIAMRGRAAVAPLADLIESTDPSLRDRMLRLLRVTRATEAAPAVAAALGRTDDPAALEALVVTLGSLGVDETAPSITEVLNRASAPSPLREACAKALSALETTAAVPTLLDHLLSPDPAVRVASAEALRHITNHAFGKDWKRSRESDRESWAASWRSFWEAHQSETREQWIDDGYGQAGFTPGHSDIESRFDLLVRAIDGPPHVSRNAQEQLSELTGLPVRPTSNAKAARGLWLGFWEDARGALAGD